MKLKAKSYLFIGAPLLVQLGITAILFANVATLERRVAEENFAKKVLSIANREQQMANDCVIEVATQRFSNSETLNRGINKIIRQHRMNVAKLRQLASQDPANKKFIEDFVDATDLMMNQVRDFFGSTGSGALNASLYRTYQEGYFNFELLVTIRRVSIAEKALRSRFIEGPDDTGTDTMREQERLRFLLVCALVMNVLIAFVLASVFGKSTVDRLNQLMSNVRSFSSGIVDMREVKGDDEISDLNEQFRAMTVSRLEAEHERRAILQTVSHDIRGPVGMLGLSIDLLWQTFEKLSEDELSHRLSVLSRESGRLVDLCNTFLDLEKFDSDSVTLNIQKVDLVLLCERARESVEILTNSRDQDIEIQNRDSVELYCDADRLMQVLVNLLSNAIKFSPVNSTISINIETDAVSNDTVISVRDEGSGFSSEDASRLFEKFSQLNNAKGRAGSGLGLWICKQLVELHGATISCSSAPGEGTTFTIRFPRVQSEARI